MEFLNQTGQAVKVRIREHTGYRWVTVKPGASINLQSHYGIAMGLTAEIVVKNDATPTPTEKPLPAAKETHIEPKPEVPHESGEELKKKREILAKEYKKLVLSIHGVGKKTAEDVILAFPTLEALQAAVDAGTPLPFRNDVETAIRNELK